MVDIFYTAEKDDQQRTLFSVVVPGGRLHKRWCVYITGTARWEEKAKL